MYKRVAHNLKTQRTLNEQEIISQILKSNQEAFNELYTSYKNQVYNTTLSYLQNTEDAEEVTQDVFLTVFEKLDTFKGNSKTTFQLRKVQERSHSNHSSLDFFS